AHRHAGADGAVDHLVERAVAAHGHHRIVALLRRGFGQYRRVTGALGPERLRAHAPPAQLLLQPRPAPAHPAAARGRIDDECQLHHANSPRGPPPGPPGGAPAARGNGLRAAPPVVISIDIQVYPSRKTATRAGLRAPPAEAAPVPEPSGSGAAKFYKRKRV